MRYLGIIVLLGAILLGVSAIDRATEVAPRTEPHRAERSVQSAYGPRTVEVGADRSGHFMVGAHVNGRAVTMLADTGASSVVLTQDDARRAGFNPGTLNYTVPVVTANGTAHVAPVSIDRLEVDGIVMNDVAAFVARPEALQHSLLGMSFIGRLSRFSMEGGRLLLAE
jgi:aspartyl protease family protein